MKPSSLPRQLSRRAAGYYAQADRFARYFAAGKLAADPAFPALLNERLIPHGARILDLGCGQGLLSAWLAAANEQHASGAWPAELATPPRGTQTYGLDLSPANIQRAQTALSSYGVFVAKDICSAHFPPSDVCVMLDVLHYVRPDAQEQILQRVAQSLSANGRLILRVADARGGWRYRYSCFIDQCVVFLRSGHWTPLYGRSTEDWQSLLEKIGFKTKSIPLGAQNALVNVLLACDRLANR